MTLQPKSFGSKCTLSEKFITAVSKIGIVEAVLTWAKFKADNQLKNLGPKHKQRKLTGIPKLEDANDAGTVKSMDCTLILTEGDSAKTMAVSGIASIGRDKYGIFPLKGKLLNVREATHKQILENAEINNIIKILGLQYKKKYETRDDLKTLRYGKLMIMTDQDQDGSHIKGLLINFIHHNWPSLLKMNFIEEFITPIVKASKGSQIFSFFSMPEFEEWKRETDNYHTYNIKYYKGLGTSTTKEAKEYFQNMARHRVKFRYEGNQDDQSIIMAFSKKCVDQRKEWLINHMEENKRRKEIGLGERYLYEKDTTSVSYADFVNLELVLFSNYDNVRSIPSMIDGLKPGQRKVLYTCLKRNDKREVKVAQLAASVAEKTEYHHGETSLMSTIINLAQNFVGSNNINLLQPIGQFGTRLNGGKDASSPRYIYTMLSPLTRLLFHKHDDALLIHEFEDNKKVEPVQFVPIIPMVLVNGADGIGTGWMTKIPNYNPREIVDNLMKMMEDQDPRAMIPYYKNYTGTIDAIGDYRYVISGEIKIIGPDKVEITELPVGAWTQVYKESVLNPMLNGTDKQPALITDYKDYSSDTTVHFIVTVNRDKLREMEKEGLHKVFKLQTTTAISSMTAFDENRCLKKYDSVIQIMKEFYNVRLTLYEKRKEYLEGILEAEAAKLSNQSRFICEKCDGTLTVENKKKKDMIAELVRKKYASDPVTAWKMSHNKEDVLEGILNELNETMVEGEIPSSIHEIKSENYDYLLGMTMWTLTKEKKDDLLRQRDEKLAELKRLQAQTPKMLWKDDLKQFLQELDKIEEKERKEEEKSMKNVKKPPTKFYNKDEMRRIEPLVDADLKRKIEKLDEHTKDKKEGIVKEKGKRGKKAAAIDKSAEKDEFDAMIEGSKPLSNRLSSDKPEKKGKKADKGDKEKGLKQTKLPFKAAKKKKNFDESDESVSDIDFSDISPPPVPRARRAGAATKKYKMSDDESESNEELFDITPTSPKEIIEKMTIDSDSDDDIKAAKKKPKPSSEELFDSLVSSDTSFRQEKEEKKVDEVISMSDDSFKIASPLKKTATTKRKAQNGGAKATKKTTKKKTVASDDSESEDMFSAKTTKRKKKVDSDDTFEVESSPIRKPGGSRARKAVSYAIKSDDSDSD